MLIYYLVLSDKNKYIKTKEKDVKYHSDKNIIVMKNVGIEYDFIWRCDGSVKKISKLKYNSQWDGLVWRFDGTVKKI